MDEPFVGTIFMWPLSWAPVGYAFCNGQTVPVNQYQALYSLIGNIYGGDTTNFALPNLQGRFPLGVGVDPQGANHQLAQKAGSFLTPISAANLPLHTHGLSLSGTSSPATGTGTVTINGVNGLGDQPYPGGNFISGDSTASATPFTSATPAPTLAPLATGSATISNLNVTLTGISGQVQPGGGSPTPNPIAVVPPYLTLNFIIALLGIYPPRP